MARSVVLGQMLTKLWRPRTCHVAQATVQCQRKAAALMFCLSYTTSVEAGITSASGIGEPQQFNNLHFPVSVTKPRIHSLNADPFGVYATVPLGVPTRMSMSVSVLRGSIAVLWSMSLSPANLVLRYSTLFGHCLTGRKQAAMSAASYAYKMPPPA